MPERNSESVSCGSRSPSKQSSTDVGARVGMDVEGAPVGADVGLAVVGAALGAIVGGAIKSNAQQVTEATFCTPCAFPVRPSSQKKKL